MPPDQARNPVGKSRDDREHCLCRPFTIAHFHPFKNLAVKVHLLDDIAGRALRQRRVPEPDSKPIQRGDHFSQQWIFGGIGKRHVKPLIRLEQIAEAPFFDYLLNTR